jgi:MFS family permease
VAIGVGSAAVLLTALDAYVVVSLFTSIAADMHVAVNNIQFGTPIVTGFLLGYAGGMPLLGGLSDKIGRKTVVLSSLGGFLVGSVITAYSTHLASTFESSGSGIGQWLAQPLHILIIGRTLQGIAGGALLPVTLALVADLWDEARRPAILGTVGAAQELGSVLGPLYGLWLAGLFGAAPAVFAAWRGVFWVNVPLSILAMVGVGFALPGGKKVGDVQRRAKVDITGGLLLAVSLALLVVGLYNADPSVSILPPHGLQFVTAGLVVLVLFIGWEWVAKTKIVDLTGSPKLPFAAVLAASLVAGAALMVTLLDVTLLAQGVFMKTQADSAILLVHFLAALPVGAVLGGLAARKVGLRLVAAIGFLVSTFAYWLISTWPITVLTDSHHILGISLPRLATDLAIAGFGLGLVIAPLSAAVLRIVPASQHGVASASVVVARTVGMLVGFAALTGWGLNRFHKLTVDLAPPVYPFGDTTQAKLDVYNAQTTVYLGKVSDALLTEYHEIFLITAALCVVAAVIAIAIEPNRAAGEKVAIDDAEPAPAA